MSPMTMAVRFWSLAVGFIGGALVSNLLASGARVRSVDAKPVEAWYQVHENAETLVLDLKLREHCEHAVAGITDVYNLAADMGGMGFIENNKALCMLSSLDTLMAAGPAPRVPRSSTTSCKTPRRRGA